MARSVGPGHPGDQAGRDPCYGEPVSHEALKVSPAKEPRHVRLESGEVVPWPAGWNILPPGDATLTRRVKAAGPTWTIQEKKGRKTFSHGVLAPAENIVRAQDVLEAERATPEYQKKLAAGRKRRAKAQEAYVEDFRASVFEFLAFAPKYRSLADEIATRVAAHATPVGSGTVARTKRIPVEERAEAAVIAWMRHQTTAYDDMRIERRKGARREVRRELARRSRKLLERYRRGEDIDLEGCPLGRLFLI